MDAMSCPYPLPVLQCHCGQYSQLTPSIQVLFSRRHCFMEDNIVLPSSIRFGVLQLAPEKPSAGPMPCPGRAKSRVGGVRGDNSSSRS